MSSEPREYLRHILVEVDYLISQRGGLTLEDFVGDETLRRALFGIWRSLERRLRKSPWNFARSTQPWNGGPWLACATV